MDKIRDFLVIFTEVVEIVVAIITAVATVFAIIGLVPQLGDFWANRAQTTVGMSAILSKILTIVIGSELIRMLLQPNPETVTEVLVILIARHIIVHQTTPMENLVSVIAIAILYILRHLLISDAERENQSLRIDRLTKFFTDTINTFGKKGKDAPAGEKDEEDA